MIQHSAPLCLVWFLTLVGCSAPPSPAPSLSADEIAQFIDAYDRVSLDKDTTRLAAYLDSNFVYFNSNGQIRSRQWALDLVGHPSYRVEDMTRTEIDPRIHGAIAVVGTRWTATPYYEGTRYEDDQRCVLTIAKQADALRLLSEHCTEIVE